MSSGPTSLVLGTAFGLPPSQCAPFVRSLRNTDYRGRLGLVLADYDDADLRRFEELADFTLAVDDQYGVPFWPPVRKALQRVRRTQPRWVYPSMFFLSTALGAERASARRWRDAEFYLEGLPALRFDHYYDVLQRVAPDADQILLTDVRDVLFQGDPFDAPVEALEVFLEDPSVTVGGNRHNREWIRDLYGEKGVRLLERFTVSCSGTVVGRRSDILHYLREMSRAISWRRRPLGVRDQGVHNYLLRTGQLRQANIVRNGYGRVLTMGAMRGFQFHPDGRILNADGTLPSVLHQYDRHTLLAQQLHQRLAT